MCSGRQVKRGEHILAVETDKAKMEVESAVTGRLKKILAGNDQTVAMSGAAGGQFQLVQASQGVE